MRWTRRCAYREVRGISIVGFTYSSQTSWTPVTRVRSRIGTVKPLMSERLFADSAQNRQEFGRQPTGIVICLPRTVLRVISIPARWCRLKLCQFYAGKFANVRALSEIPVRGSRLNGINSNFGLESPPSWMDCKSSVLPYFTHNPVSQMLCGFSVNPATFYSAGYTGSLRLIGDGLPIRTPFSTRFPLFANKNHC